MRILARRDQEPVLRAWNPFREVDALHQEMDRLFGRMVGSGGLSAEFSGFEPSLEVYETPDAYRVFVGAPGVSEQDLHVELTENRIAISGERKPWIEGEQVTQLFVSRNSGTGKFSVAYDFPTSVQDTEVKATYRQGVLEIWLPKVEKAKPRSIQVKVES